MDIKILDIADSAYLYYKKTVKGNKYTTKDQVARKLTRNMLLSLPTKRTKDGQGVVYAYGHMRFMVRNNIVEWVDDTQKQLPMWFLDKEKHKKLTEQLEIYEYSAEERTQMEEIKRASRMKDKQISEAKKHLLYLKRDLNKILGNNENNSWIIGNVDTILSLVD